MSRYAIVALVSLTLACHHRLTPAPAESDCGAAVFISPLPPDSVARRYMRAFEALGLDDYAWFSQADTAFATSVPTVLARDTSGARWASRVVAYRRWDATRYRTYVTLEPPTGGWAPGDSVARATRRRTDAFCEELSRRAAVQGARGQAVAGEIALPVWKLGRSPALER